MKKVVIIDHFSQTPDEPGNNRFLYSIDEDGTYTGVPGRKVKKYGLMSGYDYESIVFDIVQYSKF